MISRFQTIQQMTVAALLSLFLAACGKKAETNPATSAQQQNAPAPLESAPATVSGTEAPSAQNSAVSDPAELNRALRKWILRNQRPPKNFDDFAASSGIQISPPPDGKKYAIDKTMHVVLVKR